MLRRRHRVQPFLDPRPPSGIAAAGLSQKRLAGHGVAEGQGGFKQCLVNLAAGWSAWFHVIFFGRRSGIRNK
jgi:hypothetical protein